MKIQIIFKGPHLATVVETTPEELKRQTPMALANLVYQMLGRLEQAEQFEVSKDN